MTAVPYIVFLCVICAVHGHYLRWIENGGTCQTIYGELLQCVNPDNCYPSYAEPEGRPEICGVDGPATVMCCLNDFSQEWSNEESSVEDNMSTMIYPNFPYSPAIQNQSSSDTKPSKLENRPDTEPSKLENRPDTKPLKLEIRPDAKPSKLENRTDTKLLKADNALEPQSNNSTEQRSKDAEQSGITGRISENGSELIASVVQNVTISFPFYGPTPENSTSLRKCRTYYQDRKLPLWFIAVVGGRDARPGEFTHMAVLGYGSESNIQWLCGGTLISEQFVLTAAHCRSSRRFGNVTFVRLGALNLSSTENETAVNYGVSSIISHPLYTGREKYHDIALIKLNESVFFTDLIKPACLATRWDLKNITLNVTGWGLTEYLGDSATILQTAALQQVSNERCRDIYGNPRELTIGVIETLQVCADGGTARRDTCQGDSGGPLQFTNNFYDFGTFPEIAGITSLGIKCALTAGVYTRVLPYVPWIESIVWPNE